MKQKNWNIFGWESINPAYGGAGSGGINDLYDIVSLNQGLENAGFSINQELVDFYNNYGADNPEMSIQKQSWTLPEPPVDTYSDELIKSAKAYSDVAVVVLSRKAGEGHNDIPMDVRKAHMIIIQMNMMIFLRESIIYSFHKLREIWWIWFAQILIM